MIQFSEKTDKNVLVRGVQNLAVFFISVLSIQYNEFTYMYQDWLFTINWEEELWVVRVESPRTPVQAEQLYSWSQCLLAFVLEADHANVLGHDLHWGSGGALKGQGKVSGGLVPSSGKSDINEVKEGWRGSDNFFVKIEHSQNTSFLGGWQNWTKGSSLLDWPLQHLGWG